MDMEVEQVGPSKEDKYRCEVKAGGDVYYTNPVEPSSEASFTNLRYEEGYRGATFNLPQASSNTMDSYRQWQAGFLFYNDQANIDENNDRSGGGTSILTRVPLVGAPHHLSHSGERMDIVQAPRSGSGHIDKNLSSHSQVDEVGIALPLRIRSHPSYPRLVSAYLNCQKVGAPAEVVAVLEELSYKEGNISASNTHAHLGNDPELDRFMDAYCNVLQEYYEELTRPFQEAMMFCRKIELQLNSLTKAGLKLVPSDEMSKTNASSDEEEEVDVSHSGTQLKDVDLLANDSKIKEQLLEKYSGYISSLRNEFLKKKKKGKLPKEARKKLLDWWNQHYKWPYPSEGEKACLAVTTGLDHKQINNWFINQRKRHWKPTEDMHYIMHGDTPSQQQRATLL